MRSLVILSRQFTYFCAHLLVIPCRCITHKWRDARLWAAPSQRHNTKHNGQAGTATRACQGRMGRLTTFPKVKRLGTTWHSKGRTGQLTPSLTRLKPLCNKYTILSPRTNYLWHCLPWIVNSMKRFTTELAFTSKKRYSTYGGYKSLNLGKLTFSIQEENQLCHGPNKRTH